MRSVLVVAVALVLIFTVSAAIAEPYVSVWADEGTAASGTSSWYGNVGMIVTPTAVLPPASAATLQYHRIQRSSQDLNVWGVNFGVTDWLEAGGARVDQETGTTETIGNVKVRIPASKMLSNHLFPEVAVGCVDVTNRINRAYYVVMTKSFGLGSSAYVPRINLHLGFADNKANAGAMDGLFGGVEFNALSYGLVQAEWDGDKFNADFRYNASKHLSLDLGLLDNDLGYGATYKSQF